MYRRGLSSSATSLKRVVVVDGVRLPFARSSSLYDSRIAYDLMRDALKGLVVQSALPLHQLDYVVCGTVIQEVTTSNIAREAALGAGIPRSVPAHTVTQACISSSQAITTAAEKILAGRASVVLAGGVETFSDVPIRFHPKMRKRLIGLGKAMKGGLPKILTHMLSGFSLGELAPQAPAIQNFHTNEVMGNSSDRLSARFGVTREEMDEYSVDAHKKALKAHEDGKYDGEILNVNGSTEENLINKKTTLEKLQSLKPAFVKPHGTHTAGNSSALTDGSAATLIMDENKAKELGYKPKAVLKDWSYVGVDPFEELLLGPSYAINEILTRNNLTLDDIDYFEIHEAFAGQVLSNLKAMNDEEFCKNELKRDGVIGKVDMNKVNTWGSSLSIGHPFGATGSRLVNTAANKLQKEGGKYALIAACADSGLGHACLVEKYE